MLEEDAEHGNHCTLEKLLKNHQILLPVCLQNSVISGIRLNTASHLFMHKDGCKLKDLTYNRLKRGLFLQAFAD